MSGLCSNCNSKSLSRDTTTDRLICDSCGFVQKFDNFEAPLGGVNGPEGTFIRVGTSGTGTLYNYKDTKIYKAHKLIDDIADRLGLAPKSHDLKTMASAITQGEFGQGSWFDVFVGACAYVVMRKDKKSLPMPIAEVSSLIGCDEYELGRMVFRVVEFLKLRRPEYPDFDLVGSFERALRNSEVFRSVRGERKERMREQGVFLMQCMVKWSLTTGRRPVAVVAAVLVFVAELNEVGVRIEDVAKEVHAKVYTSKLRYKELLEALVKVAQVLPWGKNVTTKNIVKNAPFVIQYMEQKSMSRPGGKGNEGLERFRFDLDDVASECLRKDVEFGTDMTLVDDDFKYFELDFDRRDSDNVDSLKLSPECLSMIYTKFSSAVGYAKSSRESGEVHRRERRDLDIDNCTEWWSGESDLSKKLLLKQILEKDVGLNALPPSFVAGCEVYKKRREKINAAKRRIDRIMHPLISDSGDSRNNSSVDCEQPRKKRKGAKVNVIDWEDLIIETLLLHQVKPEEIEKGHYNTLMDLYVFNSGIIPEFPEMIEA
ncbi:TFIIB transcription factor [Trema orientale]|uniref:TFIIB transcription factor n=1 Tax=Trema orientale TaxID=63057 RepID=A0A2P5DKG9_TREOI|nr:TFIIB transcription factor [Trema orientale]